MPAYNAAIFIAESIRSAQQQTYTNWELIVIDDGSTDNTAALVNQVANNDKRIKYFYQHNSGQGAARNAGLKQAKADLVAFLDSDDIWMPHKLERQLEFIMSGEADLVFSDIEVIDETGKKKRDTWMVENAIYKDEEGLLAFLKTNKIPLVSTLAKKKAILAVNGFAENNQVQYGEDHDLWIRMLQAGFVFAGSSEKLASYRKHSKQSTAQTKQMIQVIERLQALKFNSNKLIETRNNVVRLWIRRFIKTSTLTITDADIKRLITLFPSVAERSFLALCNKLFPVKLMNKIILIICRPAVKKLVSTK